MLCHCAAVLSLYVWRGRGGVGDGSCLFLYSGPLTSVEKSDSDPIVEDGACINSLLVLVDRAQVKRGRGKLGPGWASPLSPSGGGGGAPLFAVFSGVTDIYTVIGSLCPSIQLAVIRAQSVTLE